MQRDHTPSNPVVILNSIQDLVERPERVDPDPRSSPGMRTYYTAILNLIQDLVEQPEPIADQDAESSSA